MRKALLTLILAFCSLGLAAQMPDGQVLEFIRQANRRGMSQAEITTELLRRGVTVQQLERLRSSGGTGSTESESLFEQATSDRLRTDPIRDQGQTAIGQNLRQASAGLTATPASRRTAASAAAPRPFDISPMLDSMLFEADRTKKTPIFGHDVFSGKSLTFEPSLNIATPAAYLLGPGDEVIIDIWGDSEQTIRQTISPDGTVLINRLGPVVLGGYTVSEAEARLRRSLGGIFASALGEEPSTNIKLSLGQIRSIQVHVMGEVENPGTYTLPSLATLFHVLYSAGGVNEIGSLREISVSRGGKRLAVIDVYSYLLEGISDVDIALRDGDVVVVPPWRNLVEVTGKVKRPMKYEMKDRQNLSSLIDYAGGFTGDAYRDAVTVVRRAGRMREVHDVEAAGYPRFTLADADSVAVGEVTERFSNRLEITGAVFRPGLYSVSGDVASVRGLVARADGLMGDAFPGRGVLTREKPDYTLEVLPLDVGAIVAGTAPDIALRNGDVLHIPSIEDLRENYTVTIRGEVQSPGVYDYADNLTIEDMIVTAGGLLESASTVKADVYRRIKNPSSISESDLRSESFSFPIRDGLVVQRERGGDFTLRPFDVIIIRTSPGYEIQKPIAVMGEVLFPGDYTLVKKEERLSDLIRKAGGALSTAYLQGAKLMRRRAEDEQNRAQSAMRLTRMGGLDSISTRDLNVEAHYSVGIDLDMALARPGSDWDLVLTEGDVLFVPEYVGTVSVSGAVLFPNTVSYREGMKIGDYIDQAGGYAHRARRRAKIVVYMNGTIARVRPMQNTRITPGCEIVVPYKSYRNGARIPMSEILSVGASTTSAASLVTTILNGM
jgi:protein involved in polysaccharide export with SLBB domain